MQFISLEAIKTDIDAALEKVGYVRTKVMCDKWEIDPNYFRTLLRTIDYKEDMFTVNGVRYISKYAKSPAEYQKRNKHE